MKLITEEIDARLRNPDGRPHLKLFVPWSSGTWLISERDPEEPNLLFGLADLGFGTPEMGYVWLSEIESIIGPGGLKIERDIHFEPKKTLVQYAEEARLNGRIMA